MDELPTYNEHVDSLSTNNNNQIDASASTSYLTKLDTIFLANRPKDFYASCRKAISDGYGRDVVEWTRKVLHISESCLSQVLFSFLRVNSELINFEYEDFLRETGFTEKEIGKEYLRQHQRSQEFLNELSDEKRADFENLSIGVLRQLAPLGKKFDSKKIADEFSILPEKSRIVAEKFAAEKKASLPNKTSKKKKSKKSLKKKETTRVGIDVLNEYSNVITSSDEETFEANLPIHFGHIIQILERINLDKENPNFQHISCILGSMKSLSKKMSECDNLRDGIENGGVK